jgi:acyl carrier protein
VATGRADRVYRAQGCAHQARIVADLPRLPNFKLDRVRLAELDAAQLGGPSARTEGSLVDQVARVFERVLGVGGATPEDNVSTLGGDSLQAVDIVLELERHFGVELSVDIFHGAHSIADLARLLGRDEGPVEDDPPAQSDAAQQIAAALRQGRPPELMLRRRQQWVGAIELLGSSGDLEAAVRGVRSLHARYPQSEFAKNMSALFDRMPAAGAQLPFTDDLERDVQVVRHPDASDVLLLFCGRSHRLGMALSAIHRWLGRLPASLVYLRDFRRAFHLHGVPSLGVNRDETLAALRRIVAELNGRRVFCYGVSSGGYPALHYGLDLGAQAVLVLAGCINLSLEFTGQMPVAPSIARLHKELPGAAIDLRQAYAAAERPPHMHLVYGDGNWDDRLHAESMSGLPKVTLQILSDCTNHNVTTELIRRGQYEPLLQEFLAL